MTELSQPPATTLLASTNHNFLRLWVGQGVSQVGSQVTLVALPLVAVITLGGTPLQVTAVTAAEYLPSLLFGLVAGVLVDKADQRRIMLATDLIRALVLVGIPVAAIAHVLSFPLLYVAVFAIGLATLFFDLAYQSGLPRIVESAHLLDANGRLETTRAASTAVGPTAGAVMVQFLGPPITLVADAVSFVISWAAMLRVRLRALPQDTTRTGRSRSLRSLRGDFKEGFDRVRHDPRQRAIIGVAATSNAATTAAVSLLPLWLRDGLGLPLWSLGVVLASGALGALAAGVVLARLSSTTAPWRRVTIALMLAGCGSLMVPLAFGPAPLRLVMVCLAEAVLQGCITVVAASCMSWRQSTTPQHLLAKVISVARTVNYGVLPVTTLAAGALASVVGIRPVLFISAGLVSAAPLWLFRSTDADLDRPSENPKVA